MTIIKASPKTPVIETPRLQLRLAEPTDVQAILAYYIENESFLTPWEPVKAPEFYTERFWLDRVRASQLEFHADQSLRMFLFPKAEPSKVVGGANFTAFVRGPFQACFLGYSVSQKHQGKGLMFEALGAAIRFVFDELNFHRIMANHLPENERSAQVLQRLGFVREGYAKEYLQIAGQWRDHVLNSLTNPNWKSTGNRSPAARS